MPERELASSMGISRPRLRQCLAQLEAEGLVQRRQGSGTYAVDQSAAKVTNVLLLVDRRLKLGEDPFFSAVTEHLQHALQAEGIRCVLERFSSGEGPTLSEDGVITLGLSGREVVERLDRRSVPMVGLFLKEANVPAGARVSLLDLDDVAAGRQALRRLAQEGCKRVVFIGHNWLPVSEARLRGVREEAEGAGVNVEVVDSGMNYVEGLTVGRGLEIGEGAGVIAANDWLAVGLRAGLLARRAAAEVHIPICSFDGLPIASDPALGIVSFAAPLTEIASDTVAELRRLAASPGAAGRSIAYRLTAPEK